VVTVHYNSIIVASKNHDADRDYARLKFFKSPVDDSEILMNISLLLRSISDYSTENFILSKAKLFTAAI
jgi:hypothetical protein